MAAARSCVHRSKQRRTLSLANERTTSTLASATQQSSPPRPLYRKKKTRRGSARQSNGATPTPAQGAPPPWAGCFDGVQCAKILRHTPESNVRALPAPRASRHSSKQSFVRRATRVEESRAAATVASHCWSRATTSPSASPPVRLSSWRSHTQPPDSIQTVVCCSCTSGGRGSEGKRVLSLASSGTEGPICAHPLALSSPQHSLMVAFSASCGLSSSHTTRKIDCRHPGKRVHEVRIVEPHNQNRGPQRFRCGTVSFRVTEKPYSSVWTMTPSL